MTYHKQGNSRPYQYRPSDHAAGMRGYWFGKLQPMEQPRPWWRKIVGK